MEWWNFNDLTFLLFFILMVSLLALVIFFFVSFFVVKHSSKNFLKKIKTEGYSVRVYTIDVKKNIVTYFNRSDFSNRIQIDLSSFYSKFKDEDMEKVKNWIFSICVNHKIADQYLEVNILLNKGKSSSFSLLKLIKYSPKTGMIHLESHLLRYIKPALGNIKKNSQVRGVVKRGVMADYIRRHKSTKGYTFCIRFTYKKLKAITNDKIERFMIMSLKNVIYPFTNSKSLRQIVELSPIELLLFDMNIDSSDQAIILASSISHAIKKCIGVNGYTDSIDFCIGVVENAAFYQDFDEMVLRAQEACIHGQQQGRDIFTYRKSNSLQHEMHSYKEQINSLIRNRSLRYLYRPIIKSSEQTIIGYFEYVRAYNSPFTSFVEISRYASRTGDNKNILAHVARHVFPKFEMERPDENVRLFFPISMLDISNVLEVFNQIPASKNIKIAIMLDEQEVNESAYQLDLLLESIQKIRDAGYELALSLKDRDLLLDPIIYYNFDYFVAGATMLGEIKKNNRVRLSIHTLIERLLKYKKPIIATDLDGWQAVEWMTKAGIDYVSSEVISASNDMLLPLEKRKIEKLKEMTNKNRRI